MGCSGNCSTCSSKCDSKEQQDMRLPQNEFSNVKKVIGVVSGKGGVGKSLVTSLLASAFQTSGKQTAILDADVTGPSIPKAFGVNAGIEQSAMGLIPAESKTGIRVMSPASQSIIFSFGVVFQQVYFCLCCDMQAPA